MAKILPYLIGAGLLLGGGLAMAASATPAVKSAKRQALDAIATGNAQSMQSKAVAMNATAPTEAGGLNRCSMFVTSLQNIPADVGGAIVSSIRSLSVVSMKQMAGSLNTKYPAQAAELNQLADFVYWLQQPVATSSPKASGAPGAAAQVAPSADTVAQQANAILTSKSPGVAQVTPVTPGVVPDFNKVAAATAGSLPPVVVAVNDRVLRAIQGGPAAMRTEAAKLRAEGYSNEAQGLELAAAAAEQAQVLSAAAGLPPAALPQIALPQPKAPTSPTTANKAPPGGAVPSTYGEEQPWQKPPVAPAPTAPTAPPVGEKRLLAGKVALAMKTAVKGKNEPRTLVMQFQNQEGLPRKDGSYGSETALSLAKTYQIVPPKPLYWGAKGGTYDTLVKDKASYKSQLLAIAKSDPQRADEWTLAAKV
jgi:hypothetical protein